MSWQDVAAITAATAATVSSSTMILQFRRLVRQAQPDFWIEGGRSRRGSELQPSLLLINSGGSDCYRIRARVLGGPRPAVPVSDHLQSQGRTTFSIELPAKDPPRRILTAATRLSLDGSEDSVVENTRMIVISGVKPDGSPLRKMFCVCPPSGPDGSVYCRPARLASRLVAKLSRL
ncbi:hypothetical protein ACQEU6_43365 [Spirillospora sp. CA-108201]